MKDLITRIKETLGRQLSAEELALAQANVTIDTNRFGIAKRKEYKAFPGGYRIEETFSIDGEVLTVMLTAYDLDLRITDEKCIVYDQGYPGASRLTIYEPHGRFFGKTTRSAPTVFTPLRG